MTAVLASAWQYRWWIMAGCVVAIVVMMAGLRRCDLRERRGSGLPITERRSQLLDREAARNHLPPFLHRRHVDARHGWRDLDAAWKAHGATDAERARMRAAYMDHPSHRSES